MAMAEVVSAQFQACEGSHQVATTTPTMSFRDCLGYQLPISSLIEGVGQTTKWPAMPGAQPQIDWL